MAKRLFEESKRKAPVAKALPNKNHATQQYSVDLCNPLFLFLGTRNAALNYYHSLLRI